MTTEHDKMLKKMFQELGQKENIKYDNDFEWKYVKLSKKDEDKKAQDTELINKIKDENTKKNEALKAQKANGQSG